MVLPEAFESKPDSFHQSKFVVSKQWKIIGGLLLALIFAFTILISWWFQQQHLVTSNEAQRPELSLLNEAYTTIQDNYWDSLSDQQLTSLFQNALSRTYGTLPELTESSKQSLFNSVEKLIKNNPEANHEQTIAQTIDLVMMNLQPFERSRLYSKQDETNLSNQVNNIDPEINLLEKLEIDDLKSDEQVKEIYKRKQQEIQTSLPDQASREAELAILERAYNALATTELRQRYQESKVEPTIIGKQLTPDIFYLAIKQFSPTTVEDLQHTLSQAGSKPGTALIIDLRGNIGGAIDGLPYFLGPFIGENQYAYQFVSQKNVLDFKTKTGWMDELVPFKRVIVLIDNNTQSSAEVMASSLKKYNVGVLVGTPTAGWGTVERVFPLQTRMASGNHYSLFLVHSLTLNDVGEAIEGHGVEPLVNILHSDWQNQLYLYFHDSSLVNAVADLIK